VLGNTSPKDRFTTRCDDQAMVVAGDTWSMIKAAVDLGGE
jgi:hypothetical protein